MNSFSIPSAQNVLQIPDLVAFWDFQEPSNAPRISRGPRPIALEVCGKVERAEVGVFGPYGARFTGEGYLGASRKDAPELGIGGAGAQVSILAWLRREECRNWGGCECVAGVWNEHAKRQYALFLNLRIWDSSQQIGAHVSDIGGPTRGFKYCMDAAIGQTPIPQNEWVFAALTFDGREARAYLNGVLDAREGRNPLPFPRALFDGGPNGADFTVGAVARPVSVGDDGTENGSIMGNPFFGVLGGLAVFNRALSASEMANLAAKTL